MICENVNIVAVVCKKIKCQHFIYTFMFMSTENDTSGRSINPESAKTKYSQCQQSAHPLYFEDIAIYIYIPFFQSTMSV